MGKLQRIVSKRFAKSGRGAKPCNLWRKQITLPDGKRVSLRLGAMSVAAAEVVSKHIDHVVSARKHNVARAENTTSWLQSAEKSLVAKLHHYGLCEAIHNPTLAEFVDGFIQRKKATAGEGTIFLCQQVQLQLKEHFGPDKRISDVTKADAKLHWHWLLTAKGLAENTAKRRLGRVREIFNDALDQEVISKNPFAQRSLPVSVGIGNKQFVDKAMIEAVIDCCPDAE